MLRRLILILPGIALLAACASRTPDPFVADAPKQCTYCDAWNEPLAPFRVVGNTYYVGTAGLASILVTSDAGHVLIDGGLSQSAPLIAANIEALGFRITDVELLLSSHAHFDHVGGLAALARASGARVVASEAASRALEHGTWLDDDPQAGFGAAAGSFPPVEVTEFVVDGSVLTVGALELTAHLTPGHTAGGTSWSWEACEDGVCHTVVYADSINPVSAPDFSYAASTNERVSFPAVQASIDRIAAAPCEILLSPHPFYFDMREKLDLLDQGSTGNPFFDPAGCRDYASEAQHRLDQRMREEGYAAGDDRAAGASAGAR